MCRTEGIIPALESSQAVYAAVDLAKALNPDQIILVCLSGRGDKDIDIVAQASGLQLSQIHSGIVGPGQSCARRNPDATAVLQLLPIRRGVL